MIDIDMEFKEHFELYLFGSSLYSNKPSDIDIAIIYDKSFISIEQAIEFRVKLLRYLSNQSKLKIDTILLSKEEERETEFLANAKYVRL